MSHIQYVDELVKEYLLFRGFSQTLKAFDNDLKAEKEKGFRVSTSVAIEQRQTMIRISLVERVKAPRQSQRPVRRYVTLLLR